MKEQLIMLVKQMNDMMQELDGCTDELVGIEASEIDTAIGDLSNASDNVNKVINRL